MKLRILKNTQVQGTAVAAGQVLDVAEGDAKILLQLKKAEPAPQEAPQAPQQQAPASPAPKARAKQPQPPAE